MSGVLTVGSVVTALSCQIFDRLFSSLGQDILDSLYYTAKYQPRRVGRMFLDFAVAIIYVDILFNDFPLSCILYIACHASLNLHGSS